jgi:hypothetical protein
MIAAGGILPWLKMIFNTPIMYIMLSSESGIPGRACGAGRLGNAIIAA